MSYYMFHSRNKVDQDLVHLNFGQRSIYPSSCQAPEERLVASLAPWVWVGRLSSPSMDVSLINSIQNSGTSWTLYLPFFIRSSFSFIRSLSSSSFFLAFSAYSSLSHFLLKSVSFAVLAVAMTLWIEPGQRVHVMCNSCTYWSVPPTFKNL